jgi:glycine cleavage system aminomethyltransferase T
MHKPFFIGRGGQLERDAVRDSSIVRFRMLKRGIPVVKPGSPVTNRRGQVVGHVTSCATIEDGSQVGLAYVQDRYKEEGTALHVFVPPRGRGHEPKRIPELKVGDRTHISDEAVVLSRFMMEGEREVTEREE